MKALSINCPNCNSAQKFPLHEKVEEGFIIKYVSCLMCREEIVIDTYPLSEHKMRSKAAILKLRKIRKDLRSFNA